MKKFQKKFDFYATNVEIDEYIFGILKGSEVDIYIWMKSKEHNITAKDKLILTIVLITIFVGVFGLGLIGVIYSLSS